MHQAGVVDGFEAGEHLGGEVASFVELEGAALLQKVFEGRSIDVLHGDELGAVQLDQIEDAADVRGDHLARGAHLLAERFESPLVLEQALVQRLECDVDPQLQVEGAPHFPHPSSAEPGANAVALAEDHPWTQLSRRRIEGRGVRGDAAFAGQRARVEGERDQAPDAQPGGPGLVGERGATVGALAGLRWGALHEWVHLDALSPYPAANALLDLQDSRPNQ